MAEAFFSVLLRVRMNMCNTSLTNVTLCFLPAEKALERQQFSLEGHSKRSAFTSPLSVCSERPRTFVQQPCHKSHDCNIPSRTVAPRQATRSTQIVFLASATNTTGIGCLRFVDIRFG